MRTRTVYIKNVRAFNCEYEKDTICCISATSEHLYLVTCFVSVSTLRFFCETPQGV